MSATSIVNAAPLTIQRGTQDLSTRPIPREPEAIPTHLPKVYIYAQKGPTTPELVVGGSRTAVYGADTFDERKKYANHATVLSNIINAEGNAQMIQRIVPSDAAPPASMLLSMDILPTQVTDYVRSSDGSFALDVDGDKIPVMNGGSEVKVAGYKVKFVVTANNNFGQATIVPGNQTDPDTSVQSQRIPLAHMRVSSQGEWGNDIGVKIWAPNNQTGFVVSPKLLSEQKVFPYRMSVVKRSTSYNTGRVIENLFGEQSVEVTFKKDVIDPTSDRELFVGEHFLKWYENTTDVNYPLVIGDIGDIHVYTANLETVLGMLYTAEKAYIDTSSTPSSIVTDFTGAADEQHLYNFVSGTSSEGYPYHTLAWDTSTGSVSLGLNTTLYFAGGSDGTMNDVDFAAAVGEEVAEYNNDSSELLDVAQNVESIIYDSGFPLQTKFALLNIIAKRKDTCVVLGTHVAGDPAMSAIDENAVAIALRTRAENFPESDYFGTPVARCVIMGRSGVLRSRQYKKRLPMTLEVAAKAARYMGAGNGSWKNGFDFDSAPGSILTYMSDVNVVYTPAGARNRDWDAGMNWVQRYDRESLHIPALQTVYSEDTSVLNNFLTVMAICEINKVADRAWRHFSGISKLSNAQLAARVDEFISGRLLGRFDGRFIIEPNTYFTEADIARGYSWSTAISIYAANMKTVMTTHVKAHRIDDYQPSN